MRQPAGAQAHAAAAAAAQPESGRNAAHAAAAGKEGREPAVVMMLGAAKPQGKHAKHGLAV